MTFVISLESAFVLGFCISHADCVVQLYAGLAVAVWYVVWELCVCWSRCVFFAGLGRAMLLGLVSGIVG